MLTPLQFAQRANTRFADNEYQNITEKSFRDFADDIRNTFVAQAALNVPDYEPGRLYTAGFIIRHSFGGAAPVFLVATKGGFLPAPTDPELDDNWLPTLSPASGPALSQAGTVPGMLRAQGSWVPGRLYRLIGRVGAIGEALDDVCVKALSAGQLEPTGYTISQDSLAAEPVLVSYDRHHQPAGQRLQHDRNRQPAVLQGPAGQPQVYGRAHGAHGRRGGEERAAGHHALRAERVEP